MKILTIASVTLREALRRKIQVNLVIFGVVLVVASYLVSTLTIGDMHRIIADLGLSAMQLIGTLLAVFLGSALVAGDIERRVVYPVMAKPVTRTQYLVGRYLGLALTLVLNLAVMAAALAAVLVIDAHSLKPLDGALLSAFAMMAVQLLTVAAVAVLFSSLTTTTLAAIFTLSIALAGQLTNDMRTLWRGGGAWVAQLLWYALPNLGSLTVNDAVVYRHPVPATAWIAAVYGLLYAAFALSLASVAFERRDFR